MSERDCRAGRQWDSLVNECVPSRTETRPEPRPVTEPPLAVVFKLKPTTHSVQPNSVMVLSPALWIFVVLAMLGSILALALWLVIYKRQTSFNSTTEGGRPQQEHLQKTEPPAVIHFLSPGRNGTADMLQRAAGAPLLCANPDPGAQAGEEASTAGRDATKHAGLEGGGGLTTCSTLREHRIPLPATELGGTALVTTKTM